MAQNTRTGDLTSGPMLQKIILFSLPLAASSILQLLFNAADVVVVGRFAGSTALAAVGSNGALINLLVNLFVGLSLGANVVAARCFGAKDDEGVRNTVQTSVTLGLVSGFFLAVVGFFAARVLLELMSCPEDVIGLSTLYLKIYFIGMPMTMLYNFSSALLRAVGVVEGPEIRCRDGRWPAGSRGHGVLAQDAAAVEAGQVRGCTERGAQGIHPVALGEDVEPLGTQVGARDRDREVAAGAFGCDGCRWRQSGARCRNRRGHDRIGGCDVSLRHCRRRSENRCGGDNSAGNPMHQTDLVMP